MDSFQESKIVKSIEALRQGMDSMRFGSQEKDVLRLFYDERLKVRRRKVPKFHLYARACEGKSEASWPQMVLNVEKSLLNLKSVGYVEKAGVVPSEYLGEGSILYQLTADGLEVLQSMHPPVTLRLKAWIAVMPPWLVLVGSIAGAIGAIWKIIDFISQLVGAT